ncbi:hypothetical protein [Planomonospora algeriensis]
MQSDIERYQSQFEAFSDLINLVPHASELDSTEKRFSELGKMMKTLDEAERERLLEISNKHFSNLEEFSLSDYSREIIENLPSSGRVMKLVAELYKSFEKKPRTPILLNSLVVTAVSAFEVQVANLATHFFEAHPEALDAGQKEQAITFTLSDLKGLENIKDATRMAISRRVESLIFGSLADWRKFFKDRMNVDMAELSIDWDKTKEIFQRRHVIVHNGGHASRRYISQVSGLKGIEVPDEGEYLPCDQEYVHSALDELLTLGILLSVAVALKINKEAKKYLIGELLHNSYEALVRNQWRVTEKMCSYGADNSENEENRTVFIVNRWIARARTGGDKSIRAEVSSWDTSALSRRYKLAKYCLLKEDKKALECLADLVEAGEIKLEDVLEWPLLEGLRSDLRFSVIISTYHAEKKANTSVQRFRMSANSKVVHLQSCPRARSLTLEMKLSEVIKLDCLPCKICSPVIQYA